tara:strand:- start:376 stop:591 length:216 start_codon:yes stop_codon:yes gene_type:complete
MLKLHTLSDDFGFHDPIDMLESYLWEGIMPAICMNKGCDYSTEYEPDQNKGWCECCSTNTVTSAAVLMGVM